jgi:hypothetical protein
MSARRVLSLVLCLGLVGCGSSNLSASPSDQTAIATASAGLTLTPTAIASPLTATPTPNPTPTPSPEIRVGSIARVVTDGLRVRSRPEVSDASKKFEPLLKRGQDLFIVKGPVAGSGYRWYEVQPIGNGIDDAVPFGWVAAGDKTGEPWIKGGGFDCPAKPTTVASFVALEPLAWVACHGRKAIAFPARLADPEATCGVDIGWTITPGWLASTCPHPEFIVLDTRSTPDDSFYSVIDPSLDTRAFRPGPERKDWIAVKVTGHFDHKAAQKCKGISTENDIKVPIGRDEIITGCRATFVITAIERRS